MAAPPAAPPVGETPTVGTGTRTGPVRFDPAALDAMWGKLQAGPQGDQGLWAYLQTLMGPGPTRVHVGPGGRPLTPTTPVAPWWKENPFLAKLFGAGGQFELPSAPAAAPAPAAPAAAPVAPPVSGPIPMPIFGRLGAPTGHPFTGERADAIREFPLLQGLLGRTG